MSALVGTGQLAKLNFRRDRVMLPAWVFGLTIVGVGVTESTKKVYTTAAKRLDFAAGVNKNPSMRALYGPVNDATSIGSVSIWKIGGIATALIGIMAVLLIVRHTRGDEESGRLELVSAGVVGRYAALTSGLITAFTANLVIALLVFGGFKGMGLPVAGSLIFALGWFFVGMMFAAVAAVTAQLTTSSRAANGIAFAVMGVSYLLRALGDAVGHNGPHWLTWLSPFGWVANMRPYAGDHWWLLAVMAAFTVVCIGAAYALLGSRDLGAGLLPDRLGPPEAVASLRTPLALAWRLERGSLLAWAVGFLVYGAAIGGVTGSLDDMLGGKSGRDVLARLGGHQNLTDAFLTTAAGIMALVAAAYAVQAVLRLRSAETSQLVEPLLATRVGRIGWAASHLAFALVGPAILLGVDGAISGLVYGARSHDLGTQWPRVMWSMLVQLPAVWVLAGIAIALFGLVPRYATAAWGLLGVFLLLGELGPVLKLKQWAIDISPFTHIPKLPGGDMQAMPIVWLSVLAAALIAVGLTGLRRRDIG